MPARHAGVARVQLEFERLGTRVIAAQRGAKIGEERVGAVDPLRL
jgi:hypothetical protein